MHITLHHVLLSAFHIDRFVITSKEDTSALARGNWLHDEGLSLLLRELVLKVGSLVRENPGFGKVVIFSFKDFLHAFQVTRQVVLVT